MILDVSHGHFAVYAHLQPGSLRIKVGDHVTAGQVLALVGNSGNSDAPRLHFRLVEANSPMAAEGTPFELATLTQLGVVDDSEALDAGEPWLPKPTTTPVVHRREFPTNATDLAFP